MEVQTNLLLSHSLSICSTGVALLIHIVCSACADFSILVFVVSLFFFCGGDKCIVVYNMTYCTESFRLEWMSMNMNITQQNIQQ